MSQHHNLDIYPVPKSVLYINEVGIADPTTYNMRQNASDSNEEDNVRIYIPMDLNHYAIIRRLRDISGRLEYPTEYNEFEYYSEFQKIITELEIYDQVWCVREGNFPKVPDEHWHSKHALEVVEEILDVMEDWAACSSAECFPFEEIDALEKEYGIKREHWW